MKPAKRPHGQWGGRQQGFLWGRPPRCLLRSRSEGFKRCFIPFGCRPHFCAAFLLNALWNLDRHLEDEDVLGKPSLEESQKLRQMQVSSCHKASLQGDPGHRGDPLGLMKPLPPPASWGQEGRNSWAHVARAQEAGTVGSRVLTRPLSGGSGTPAWGPSGLRGWALVTVGVWGGGASPPSEGGRDLRTTGFVADLLSPTKLSARAAHTLPRLPVPSQPLPQPGPPAHAGLLLRPRSPLGRAEAGPSRATLWPPAKAGDGGNWGPCAVSTHQLSPCRALSPALH